MIDDDKLPEGATPLDPDEAEGLIPGLTTRGELNTFEQRNIARAVAWSRSSKKLRSTLFEIESLKFLHKRMFDETWKWAGKFRLTGKNIGVEPAQIQMQLHMLSADGNYWLDNQIFPIEECAIRFHHRLVSIHAFPNGNGRHARLVADLLMYYSNRRIFSWGGESLDVEGKTRQRYIQALQQADAG
ncbi:MAG: mobile mystery protein B, partial [Candidatus Melainabacteria bacterium]|nr:mobile mystery protein B [Candidatus Melainabacteria bacterium]